MDERFPRRHGRAKARLVAACLLATAVAALSAATAVARGVQDDLRAARTKGSPTAPVTVYDMSDFQCPACGQFAREVMPALDREYIATGRVKFIFINLPLPQHANATPAAELAMCAARQNRFWPVHDLLFRHQARWSELREPGSFFLALGDSAGADRDSLVACLRSNATRAMVQSDAAAAIRSGARSTPSFYIEGGMMAGTHPISVWRPILDSIIRSKAGR